MRAALHTAPAPWSIGSLARLPCIVMAFVLALLAGCAQPPKAPAEALSERTYWSGRLALQVEEQAAQSFSAAFELQGNATRGELTLLNPLGNVLAQLHWQPGNAHLQADGKMRESASLPELLEQTVDTPIPVLALFSWLRGLPTTAPGWQADLSAIDQGRLVATRYEPLPRATLRVTFER